MTKSMTSNVGKKEKPLEHLSLAGGTIITLEHSLAVSYSVIYTYSWQSNSIPMHLLPTLDCPTQYKVYPPKIVE